MAPHITGPLANYGKNAVKSTWSRRSASTSSSLILTCFPLFPLFSIIILYTPCISFKSLTLSSSGWKTTFATHQRLLQRLSLKLLIARRSLQFWFVSNQLYHFDCSRVFSAFRIRCRPIVQRFCQSSTKDSFSPYLTLCKAGIVHVFMPLSLIKIQMYSKAIFGAARSSCCSSGTVCE